MLAQDISREERGLGALIVMHNISAERHDVGGHSS